MLRRTQSKRAIGLGLLALTATAVVVAAQPEEPARTPPADAATRPATTKADGRDDARPAAAESTKAASPASSPPAGTPASGPRSADQVLGEMLQPRRQGQQQELTINEPPAADRTSGDGAVKPHAPVLTVMREGTPVVNRVGRLTLGTGAEAPQAEFKFESDGQALRDPPLIILPNLRLMAMEDAVRAASRDLRFRVSGVVTEYRGRNYLLLEKVTVVQDVTQQFKPM